MEKSKLIQLVKTFSGSEWRAFRDFVASPFFNKNQELLLLCDYLKKLAPNFPPKKLMREKAYARLFPHQPYDEKHLNYLMSFLLKLGEQFMAYQGFSQAPGVADYYRLLGLSQRHLDKHFDQVLRKNREQTKGAIVENAEHYHDLYLIADIDYQHFLRKNVRKFDLRLQAVSDHLDHYYLLQKLKYACEMYGLKQTINAHYQQDLVPYLKRYLAQYPPQTPLLTIYYHILLSLTDADSEKHFNRLKTLIFQHSDHIAPKEMSPVYIHAANYCIRMIRNGKSQYATDSLELYEKGIAREILFEAGFLNPWVYKNVVKLALSLKRYDWTEQFIHQYTNSLKEEFRHDAHHYNLAELNYYRFQYEEALDHINQVEFSDVHYNLGSRKLFLKIYYERNEEEALHSQIAAFSIYLKRNKLIPTEVKAPYKHFIRILSQILRHKHKPKDQLRTTILQTPQLTDRNWLLRILD